MGNLEERGCLEMVSERNSAVGLKETGRETVDSIHLAQVKK
jgi:hypothetical protein